MATNVTTPNYPPAVKTTITATANTMNSAASGDSCVCNDNTVIVISTTSASGTLTLQMVADDFGIVNSCVITLPATGIYVTPRLAVAIFGSSVNLVWSSTSGITWQALNVP